MRKLGQELDVHAMSLYNHVGSKDEIRDGIVELVMQEIELPSAGRRLEGRRSAASAISAHDVLIGHPWACGLINSTNGVGSARLRLDGGDPANAPPGGLLGEPDAPCVPRARQSHHRLHALAGRASRSKTSTTSRTWLRRSCARSAVDEYPYLAEHVRGAPVDARPEGEGEFEFGLDLILDGIERIRDALAA